MWSVSVDSHMRLAGKCEPDAERIKRLSEAGFENIELYLDTTILDNQDDIIQQCRDSDVTVATVHTPHLDFNSTEVEYYKMADEIAAELDATLVLDSWPISTISLPNLMPESDINAPRHGYENNPSISSYYMRVNHLEQDLPLILDTAHLHMSESSYVPFLENILATYTVEQIPAIHLADGKRTVDGLPYGQGTIDIETIVMLLERYNYDGPVVLETTQTHQPDALKRVREYLKPDGVH